ncbi:MAG: RagB/SusD family nutrient uptake outer membrane protein [Bacteroidales bacterium]
MKNIIKYLILLVIGFSMVKCDLDVIPQDALTSEQITTTSDGLSSLVNGLYAIFKEIDGNNCYIRQYYQLSDFASDDIVCAYKTEDDLINSFRYKDRAAEKSNINAFWEASYKIIYGANVGISMADLKGDDPSTNQLKGESYFLRAFATHNLVRLFAKPYNQTNKNEPGVIIRNEKADNMPKARATLEDSYNYIISSLKMAESLMSEEMPADRANDNHKYASIYSVWAMLSRVYLYKQEYDSCIIYSDKLIESGAFSLETPESYPDFFANAKTSAEAIWLIPFNLIDDQLNGSVASMIFNGNNCWAEEGASASFMEDMQSGVSSDIDQRWSYIVTTDPIIKNGITMYYISKFSGQDGSSTLSSPVMFRLAEIYLNRAEAYANLGDVPSAVADLNELLANRIMVPEGDDIDNYLYHDAAISTGEIVDVVLHERRIELAFEGHRIYDLLRTGTNIVRNYWGFHLDSYNGVPGGSEPGMDAGGVLFQTTDPWVIYPIPSSEISTNKLCVQNQ